MGYDLFEIRQLGLEGIIPRRKHNKGSKPGVTGKDPLGKEKEDEDKDQWEFPTRESTLLEKRKLFGACLEIGVRKAFALHLYQFGGKLYHQKDGGPIGMRLAGSVARIVMAEWGSRMMRIMKENNIEVDLAACYVDDVRFVTSIIERGMRWDGKKKKFVQGDDWQEEDEAQNLSDEQRTARELKKAMNSIFTNIQFTTEIPDDFQNKRLPTLDCTIWLENGNILYSFYEKEMKSPFCILEQSALPDNTKISSLSQDVVRRMLNISDQVPQEERNSITEIFISKLIRSGYRQDQVQEMIKAGL